MHENHLVVGGIASGGSRPWANGGGGGGGGGCNFAHPASFSSFGDFVKGISMFTCSLTH